MATILNTSIITSHGDYSYRACSLEQAKKLVEAGFQSAIGHESTAAVISVLLGIECPMNRIQYKQQPGETALVFKLKGRAPEGKILTVQEIEEIGYEWGVLKRTDTPAKEIFKSRFKRFFGEELGCAYRYAYRSGRHGALPDLRYIPSKTAPLYWSDYLDGLKHRYSCLSRTLHNLDTLLMILSDRGLAGFFKVMKKIYNHNKYPHR